MNKNKRSTKPKNVDYFCVPRANRPRADEPLAEQVKQLERENARLRQEKEILKKQWPSSRTQTSEICLH